MKSPKFIAILISIEGLFTILWTIFSPADSQNLVFLSFSRTKIALLTSLAVIWLVSVACAWTWRREERVEALLARLDKYCLEQKKLTGLVILLLVIPTILASVVTTINAIPLESKAYESWAPVTYPVLFALAHRFLPLWLWLSISFLELAGFLAVRYWNTMVRPEAWSLKHTGAILTGLLIAVATIFHWAVLAFQLRFFANNPAWYWKIQPLPFTIRDLFFFAGIIVLIGFFSWSLADKSRAFASILSIFVMGWYLQAGIGFISGNGFTSLRERYFSTYHQVYPLYASQNEAGILENIREYESRYGNHLFTNTKPPGLMAFYIGLDKLVNGSHPEYNQQQRYERLSNAITAIFPALAMMIVFPIYIFAKRLLGESGGLAPILSPLLYILCPNIILFSLFADQAVYPLLFLVGIGLSIIVIKQQSFMLAFLFGMLLYLAIFFAFTMLPLYLFTAIYFLLDYWYNRRDRNLKAGFRTAIGIALGTVLLYMVFLVFLNYNFFPRFQQAVQINHNFDFYTRVGQPLPGATETFATRLQQTIGAAWLNNLDFAAAIGFPIYILFLFQGIRTILRALKGQASFADIVLVSLLSSFIVLNLAGTAQGEVPRLWMFWLPPFVIIAALELKDIFQKKIHWITAILAIIQAFTILLTYHFQDLRM